MLTAILTAGQLGRAHGGVPDCTYARSGCHDASLTAACQTDYCEPAPSDASILYSVDCYSGDCGLLTS